MLDQRHAKWFIKEYAPKLITNLLSENRKFNKAIAIDRSVNT